MESALEKEIPQQGHEVSSKLAYKTLHKVADMRPQSGNAKLKGHQVPPAITRRRRRYHPHPSEIGRGAAEGQAPDRYLGYSSEQAARQELANKWGISNEAQYIDASRCQTQEGSPKNRNQLRRPVG